MKAAQYNGSRTIAVGESIEIPPGPGQVRLNVAFCGICGTDIHIFHGAYSADKLPLIPGHEFTGHIAGLGSPEPGLSEGDACVVDMNIGCGRCYWCRRNEILNCPEMQQMGITIDGAFADYIVVPSRLVIPVPGAHDPAVLALTEPLSCVVRAARKARVTFGQSVVVIGVGPIGNLHVQLLWTIGAAPIIVADISEDRVEMALASGADHGTSDPDALEALVMEATQGRGADIVIESVGHPALYAQAQKLARRGGHIAAFGLTGAEDTLSLNIIETILQENSVAGSVAGMGQDMHDSLTLLTHGRINAAPFLGADYPLEDIQHAFDTFADRPGDLKIQIVM